MEKKKRIIDEDLCALVRKFPCIACGVEPCGEAHHITTRARGGDDVAVNLMPLCHEHHMQWHQKGPGFMIETYRGIYFWLKCAGREDVFDRVNRAGFAPVKDDAVE